jgi:hypothetical protein
VTQPQQPFGEARCTDAREPAVPYQQPVVGRVAYAPDANRQRIPDGSAFPPPLRETAEPVDAAELLRGHERRLAALEDAVRRLTDRLDAATKAQAL